MISPRKRATEAFKYAETLFRAGRYENALEVLADVNGMFPNNPNVLFPMALCLEKMGKCDGAAEVCGRLLDQNKDPRAERMLARLRSAGKADSVTSKPEPDGVDFGTLFGTYWRALTVVSPCTLVGTNLVPLVGVLFFQWDVFTILFVFWLENVIVGLFNVPKMILAQGMTEALKECRQEGVLSDATQYTAPHRVVLNAVDRVCSIVFFVVPYSLFCLMHIGFLSSIFLDGGNQGMVVTDRAYSDTHSLSLAECFHNLIQGGDSNSKFIRTTVMALFISHGVSFVTDFLWNGEYRRVSAGELIRRPYGRVMSMTFTIGACGAVMTNINSPQSAMAVLVLLKIVMDLLGHFAERGKFRS